MDIMWAEIVNEVRSKRPLIQAITNYVTINDCANILICFGASPAMCEASSEVEGFAAAADALYLNTGTLISEQREAMIKAARAAGRKGIPIVLDPVGVGGIPGKIDFVMELLSEQPVTVIKGNSGEIKALAGYGAGIRGVDSIDSGENVIEACQLLAKKYNTVVMATGETDTVSDGQRTALISNGHPLLTRITGSGCMVGALVAATAAVARDTFIGTVTAAAVMGVAGELAATDGGQEIGPGTYRMRLFDSIYFLTVENLRKAGQVTWL